MNWHQEICYTNSVVTILAILNSIVQRETLMTVLVLFDQLLKVCFLFWLPRIISYVSYDPRHKIKMLHRILPFCQYPDPTYHLWCNLHHAL